MYDSEKYLYIYSILECLSKQKASFLKLDVVRQSANKEDKRSLIKTKVNGPLLIQLQMNT